MEGFNLTIILVPLLILFSSMDFKHKIIQWNCRGLKPNYNEVSLLISEYNPSVFCFQETFLKPDDNISLRGFNIYNYVHTDCLRPCGGASIFVKSSFPCCFCHSRQRNNHMCFHLSLPRQRGQRDVLSHTEFINVHILHALSLLGHPLRVTRKPPTADWWVLLLALQEETSITINIVPCVKCAPETAARW